MKKSTMFQHQTTYSSSCLKSKCSQNIFKPHIHNHFWKRACALILIIYMVVIYPGSISVSFAEEGTEDALGENQTYQELGNESNKIIVGFTELEPTIARQRVEVGADISTIIFPSTIEAIVQTEDSTPANIEASCDADQSATSTTSLSQETTANEATSASSVEDAGLSDSSEENLIVPDEFSSSDIQVDPDEASSCGTQSDVHESTNCGTQENANESTSYDTQADPDESAAIGACNDIEDAVSEEPRPLSQRNSHSSSEETQFESYTPIADVGTEMQIPGSELISNITLTGIKWNIDPTNSSSDSFSSEVPQNVYVYKPMIPDTYVVSENAILPTIIVTIEEGSAEQFKYSQVVDGIRITVTADPYVFCKPDHIEVRRVTGEEEKTVNDAIEEKRPDDANVAISYTYDIKVVNIDGQEIEPDTTAGTVHVAFGLAETEENALNQGNLEANLYHVTDLSDTDPNTTDNDNTTVSAEKLDVNQITDEEHHETMMQAQTDGFSYYTMEFVYSGKLYIIDEEVGSRIRLLDMMDSIDISTLKGDKSIYSCISSDPDLIEVKEMRQEDQSYAWFVTIKQNFTGAVKLTMLSDNVPYEINVKYQSQTTNDYVYDFTREGQFSNPDKEKRIVTYWVNSSIGSDSIKILDKYNYYYAGNYDPVSMNWSMDGFDFEIHSPMRLSSTFYGWSDGNDIPFGAQGAHVKLKCNSDYIRWYELRVFRYDVLGDRRNEYISSWSTSKSVEVDIPAYCVLESIKISTTEDVPDKEDGFYSVTIDDWDYGEEPQTPVALSESNGVENVIFRYYVDSDCTILTTPDNSGADIKGGVPKLGGNYYVQATFAETEYYKEGQAKDSFRIITKPVEYTAPSRARSDMVYNSYPQTLINPGIISAPVDAKFVYSLSQDGDYTEELPTATDAGTYNVYYKVIGTDLSYDYSSTIGCVSVKIKKKKAVVVSRPQAMEHLVYNGQEQQLVTSGTVLEPSDAKFLFSDGSGESVDTIPTGKDHANYYVHYSLWGPNPNYEYDVYDGLNMKIGAKEVYILGILAIDKVYDRNLDVNLDFEHSAIEGILPSDDVSVTAYGQYLDPEPGDNKYIRLENIRLVGKDMRNYVICEDALPNCTYASITKASFSTSVVISDWGVGSEPKTPYVTYNPGYGAVTYSYKIKNEDDSTYTQEIPTVDGDYTVRAEIAETKRYLSASAETDFKIIGDNIYYTKPKAKSGIVYDGQEHEIFEPGTINDSSSGYEYRYDYYGSADNDTPLIRDMTKTQLFDQLENIPKGKDAGKYRLAYRIYQNDNLITQGSVIAVIAPKIVTVSGIVEGPYIDGGLRLYDRTDTCYLNVQNAEIAGALPDDLPKLNVTVDAHLPSVNVGLYDVPIKIGLSGDASNNYEVDADHSQQSVSERVYPYPIDQIVWGIVQDDSEIKPWRSSNQYVDGKPHTIYPHVDRRLLGSIRYGNYWDGNVMSNNDVFHYTYTGTKTASEEGKYELELLDIGNPNYQVWYPDEDMPVGWRFDKPTEDTKIIWGMYYWGPKEQNPRHGTLGLNGWYTSPVALHFDQRIKDDEERPYANYNFVIKDLGAENSEFQDELLYDQDGEYQVSYLMKMLQWGYWLRPDTVDFKIDQTPPEGEIRIRSNTFKDFNDNISFDRFYAGGVEAYLTARDQTSGVDKVQYYVSDAALSKSELEEMPLEKWTNGTIVKIGVNHKSIIYGRFTDMAGNVSYCSSDGLVIYQKVDLVTKSIEYTKITNTDTAVTVKLNGNSIDKIMRNNQLLRRGVDYLVNDDQIVVKGSYLQTITAGNHELEIYYLPMDVPYHAIEGNDEQNSVAVDLTVRRKVADYQVSIEDWGYGEKAKKPFITGDPGDGTPVYLYEAVSGDQNSARSSVPTEAGEYKLMVNVPETDNYEESTYTTTFMIRKSPIIRALGNINKRMSVKRSETNLLVADYLATSGMGKITNYRLNGEPKVSGSAVITNNAITAKGNLTVNIASGQVGDIIKIPLYVTGSNYDGCVDVVITINACEAPEYTAPCAKKLTYNAEKQQLLTVSDDIIGGEIYYSMNRIDWSKDIASATNAGEYHVWYYVKGDDDHDDTEIEELVVQISKCIPDIGIVTADELLDTLDQTKVTIRRSDDKVPGRLVLLEQKLDYGENHCQYRFYPNDQNNYEIITGNVDVYVRHTTSNHETGDIPSDKDNPHNEIIPSDNDDPHDEIIPSDNDDPHDENISSDNDDPHNEIISSEAQDNAINTPKLISTSGLSSEKTAKQIVSNAGTEESSQMSAQLEIQESSDQSNIDGSEAISATDATGAVMGASIDDTIDAESSDEIVHTQDQSNQLEDARNPRWIIIIGTIAIIMGFGGCAVILTKHKP